MLRTGKRLLQKDRSIHVRHKKNQGHNTTSYFHIRICGDDLFLRTPPQIIKIKLQELER